MTRLELVRYAVLVVPGIALWVAVRFGPSTRREHGALLLAGIAAFVGLGVLHELSLAARWWQFADVAGSFRGFPVDLWLGWALLWGPLPVALRRHIGLPTAVVAAAWLDVVAMPAMTPVVVLNESWLWGEGVGLILVLVPAALLGRWTADAACLAARATLQLVVFAGLVFWLLPTVAFTFGDGGWAGLTSRPPTQLTVIMQIAVVMALPGIAAVHELAEHGRGTPFPWDPPAKLVTTGPYAYVANPMQVSATLLLLMLAVLTGSWSLVAATAGAVAFSATVAQPHERAQLRCRFGDSVDRYQAGVGTWWPRWRPYLAQRASLFIDGACHQCRQLGAAVAAAGPTGLDQRDARTHPDTLERVRYESGTLAEDGLPAIGRAIEHTHLLAAVVGWVVRLPLLRILLQLIADTFGPPARPVREGSR